MSEVGVCGVILFTSINYEFEKMSAGVLISDKIFEL